MNGDTLLYRSLLESLLVEVEDVLRRVRTSSHFDIEASLREATETARETLRLMQPRRQL